MRLATTSNAKLKRIIAAIDASADQIAETTRALDAWYFPTAPAPRRLRLVDTEPERHNT
jgi:hypothetical protein